MWEEIIVFMLVFASSLYLTNHFSKGKLLALGLDRMSHYFLANGRVGWAMRLRAVRCRCGAPSRSHS